VLHFHAEHPPECIFSVMNARSELLERGCVEMMHPLRKGHIQEALRISRIKVSQIKGEMKLLSRERWIGAIPRLDSAVAETFCDE
jgi:hypothetical protein